MTFCLSGHLANVPPDRPIWNDSARGVFSARRLSSFVNSARSYLRKYQGKRVAILAGDDLNLALLLLALDGYCEQLTILPSTSDAMLLRSVVEESASEFVLTDHAHELGDRLGADLVAPTAFQNTRTAAGEIHRGDRPNHTGAEPIPTRWVLPSSGTTGRPKLVAHSLQSLCRSVKKDTSRGAEFVWGSLYSLGSFAGLQVFLQSWFGGSVALLGDRTLPLAEKLMQLAGQRCNALSATPTMWRMVLMSERQSGLALRRITLGGEIADQSVLNGLRRRFPEARIVHIYASTEAGFGFSVRDGREGFPRHFVDEPQDGVTIKVDENGRLLLRHRIGHQIDVASGSILHDDQGFVDSGDVVDLRGDRYFFRGRTNGTINVGGQKVHPQEVESALLKCEGIRMASVSAQRNPFTGAIVQAKIVVDSEIETSPDIISRDAIAFCRRHLEPYKVPAFIDVVDSITVSANGKICR